MDDSVLKILIALLGVVSGVATTAVFALVRAHGKRVDANAADIKEAKAQAGEALQARSDCEVRCTATMARDYVRRDDFIRAITVMDNKLDSMDGKLNTQTQTLSRVAAALSVITEKFKGEANGPR
jgi:hypothetical protein